MRKHRPSLAVCLAPVLFRMRDLIRVKTVHKYIFPYFIIIFGDKKKTNKQKK